jgi:hypothetical protein
MEVWRRKRWMKSSGLEQEEQRKQKVVDFGFRIFLYFCSGVAIKKCPKNIYFFLNLP